MWLLAGLGNPGKEYEGNRHNIGFMIADRIVDDYGFSGFKSRMNGLVSEGRMTDEKVVLVKPQTFMNESGQNVGKVARFYKIPPKRIIVFYDELDLDPFRVKVKKGGGSGGHNGIKSIDAHLGNKDYWRVRVGIGHPGDKNRVSGYVLNDFSKEEQKTLPDVIGAIADYTPELIKEDESMFMTRVSDVLKTLK